MTRLRLTLLALVAAGPLLFSGFPAAAAWTPRAEPGSAATPPLPSIDSKTTKSGVQIGGKNKKQRRLTIDVPKPETLPAKPVHPRPKLSLSDPRDTVSTKRKTRLNIGLCGREQSDGTIPGPTRCQPYVPDRPDRRKKTAEVKPRIPRPQDITWEEVVSETKDVLFPALTVKIQPKGRTLVNLETIVYTDDNGVTANWVTVLGFPVLVEATPRKFIWNFGDGTTLATDSPGNPYPSKDITHKYMKRASVNLTVTVNYTARFFVSGAGWQNVGGTVSITGPATPLLVREAVPVLVDPGR
jgi:hypothetical protein